MTDRNYGRSWCAITGSQSLPNLRETSDENGFHPAHPVKTHTKTRVKSMGKQPLLLHRLMLDLHLIGTLINCGVNWV